MFSAFAIRRDTITPLTVAGVLGLAVVAGLGQIPSGAIGIAVALGGAVVVVATLRRIGMGLALLPAICTAVPISVGTGTQSPLVAGLLFSSLLLGLWLVRSVLVHDFVIPRSWVFTPAIVLVVVWSLSYLYADAVHSPLVYIWEPFRMPRTGQLGVVIVSAGVFLLALKVGSDVRWIKIATWEMTILGALAVVLYYARLDETPFGRLFSTLGLFTMWGVALAYGQALFNGALPRWFRAALLVLVVAWLYKAIFLQNLWFSGWVPTLVAVIVITFFRSPRWFFPLGILGGVLVALNWAVVYAALWDAKVSEGDLTRVGIWQQALEIFHQNPILGTGPAGYAAYYMSLYANSQFSMSTHSNYMDILIETGIVGAIVFAWLMLALLVEGWRARSRFRSGFVGGYAHGAIGGFFGLLVAMSLGDWFIPFVYNQTIAGFRHTAHSWLFLGFLAALATLKPEAREVNLVPSGSALTGVDQTRAGHDRLDEET